MQDYSNSPLNEDQIILASVLKAGTYTNPETGKTYISKAYWNGVPKKLQGILRKALFSLRSEGGAA